MNAPTVIEAAGLPSMVKRAAATLASAQTAAEVLEARDIASVAYDTAKRASRLAAAQGAFNEIRAKITRAQAEALEIEAAANRRLADEYDAAQARGEVATDGRPKTVPDGNGIPAAADLGLSRKAIHEARLIRDAEIAEPGIVAQTIAEAIEAGEEPTRAKVRRRVLRVVKPEGTSSPPARGKAAICGRVRDALVTLSGLPSPSEVAGYFAGTDGAIIIDERLSSASRWLAEFAEIWSDQNAEDA